jgi:large subunit ribosomal protein L13
MFGKTHSTKTAEVEKKWLVIDAKGLVVGRLASIIAMRLRQRQVYSPHGRRRPSSNQRKKRSADWQEARPGLHHYSGYIGGIKERSAKSILEGKFERIVEKAVERMLAGPLGRSSSATCASTKVRSPHAAQSPTCSTSPNSIEEQPGAEING